MGTLLLIALAVVYWVYAVSPAPSMDDPEIKAKWDKWRAEKARHIPVPSGPRPWKGWLLFSAALFGIFSLVG